jgi:hypothetical protein
MDMVLSHLFTEITESWEEYSQYTVDGKQRVKQHRTAIYAVDFSDAFCSFDPRSVCGGW